MIEWYWLLAIILGCLFVMFLSGMPIAFSFILVFLVLAFWLWGGTVGLKQITLSVASRMQTFALLPLGLFLLMGEVLFQSGIAIYMLDTIDKWLGRLPGRLGLISVISGTILATLTGSSVGATAILGSLLTPEMEKRGYKKEMSLGPIMASGTLSPLIPPSAHAVFLGGIAMLSIGQILMGIIMPGLLLAGLYFIYIILRCSFKPSVAPPYQVPPTPLKEKLFAVVKYILPVGVVIFLVIGVIILGIATPSEAAATGSVGVFVLAALYGRFNWDLVKKSLHGTIRIMVMIFTILVGAFTFTQLLIFSGAARGLGQFIASSGVHPLIIFIGIQAFSLFLGMWMTAIGVITIIVPLFLPVIKVLGLDPVWFSVVLLISAEVSAISPPFGLNLFAMKGVAPPDTTMGDVYRASVPFIGCAVVAMALVIIFPEIALWLPGITIG